MICCVPTTRIGNRAAPAASFGRSARVREFAEIIARLYAPDAVEALRSVSSPSPSPGWIWTEALAATDRIIGRLEYRKQTVKDLRQAGPVLAANQLHPWVWNAAGWPLGQR